MLLRDQLVDVTDCMATSGCSHHGSKWSRRISILVGTMSRHGEQIWRSVKKPKFSFPVPHNHQRGSDVHFVLGTTTLPIAQPATELQIGSRWLASRIFVPTVWTAITTPSRIANPPSVAAVVDRLITLAYIQKKRTRKLKAPTWQTAKLTSPSRSRCRHRAGPAVGRQNVENPTFFLPFILRYFPLNVLSHTFHRKFVLPFLLFLLSPITIFSFLTPPPVSCLNLHLVLSSWVNKNSVSTFFVRTWRRSHVYARSSVFSCNTLYLFAPTTALICAFVTLARFLLFTPLFGSFFLSLKYRISTRLH